MFADGGGAVVEDEPPDAAVEDFPVPSSASLDVCFPLPDGCSSFGLSERWEGVEAVSVLGASAIVTSVVVVA